jgi:DNA-binding NarL/FixJ family response regulator
MTGHPAADTRAGDDSMTTDSANHAGAGEPPAQAPQRTIRIALAQDDFLAREGMTRVLDGLEGIELVAACTDLDALRAELERTHPDVVLIDVRPPEDDPDGSVRLAAELRSIHPLMGVILLSRHASSPEATALFADGASRRAYLLNKWLKNPADLARTIREVADGGAVVDPRVVDELSAGGPSPEREHRSPLEVLTPRELEIAALIAQGLANGAIADRLGITRHVVERRINTVFAKLELGDPADVSRRVKTTLLFMDERPR